MLFLKGPPSRCWSPDATHRPSRLVHAARDAHEAAPRIPSPVKRARQHGGVQKPDQIRAPAAHDSSPLCPGGLPWGASSKPSPSSSSSPPPPKVRSRVAPRGAANANANANATPERKATIPPANVSSRGIRPSAAREQRQRVPVSRDTRSQRRLVTYTRRGERRPDPCCGSG